MSQGFTPPSGGSFGSSSKSGSGFSGGTQSSFGGPGTSKTPNFSATTTVRRKLTSAPSERLIPSLILGLIGIGLNIWLQFGSMVATDSSFLVISGIAWVLAGVGGISLLGRYFNELNLRRANGIFTEIPWKRVVLYITAIVLLLAIVWSAFNLAQYFGKL